MCEDITKLDLKEVGCEDVEMWRCGDGLVCLRMETRSGVL
jgi:hypothetical protein